MDILYVWNEKKQRNYMLESIINKICTISNIDPYVKSISIYSKIVDGLNDNVFLLLDKIMKIVASK